MSHKSEKAKLNEYTKGFERSKVRRKQFSFQQKYSLNFEQQEQSERQQCHSSAFFKQYQNISNPIKYYQNQGSPICAIKSLQITQVQQKQKVTADQKARQIADFDQIYCQRGDITVIQKKLAKKYMKRQLNRKALGRQLNFNRETEFVSAPEKAISSISNQPSKNQPLARLQTKYLNECSQKKKKLEQELIKKQHSFLPDIKNCRSQDVIQIIDNHQIDDNSKTNQLKRKKKDQRIQYFEQSKQRQSLLESKYQLEKIQCFKDNKADNLSQKEFKRINKTISLSPSTNILVLNPEKQPFPKKILSRNNIMHSKSKPSCSKYLEDKRLKILKFSGKNPSLKGSLKAMSSLVLKQKQSNQKMSLKGKKLNPLQKMSQTMILNDERFFFNNQSNEKPYNLISSQLIHKNRKEGVSKSIYQQLAQRIGGSVGVSMY